jgi:osmotically-inducible protein OsmY
MPKTMIRNAFAAFIAATLLTACANDPQLVHAKRTIGATLDDTSIQLAINRDMSRALPGFVNNIGTEVREGRVLIVGTVDSPAQRVEAGKIAWQIRGVRDVVNELEVRAGQGFASYATDARISNQMRVRLLTANQVKATNFDIETVDGTVYILGIARTQEELEHVAYLAATISGVKRVVSHALLADDPRRLERPKHASASTYH